eukprot:3136122-Rhodomonas_salina.1
MAVHRNGIGRPGVPFLLLLNFQTSFLQMMRSFDHSPENRAAFQTPRTILSIGRVVPDSKRVTRCRGSQVGPLRNGVSCYA